MRSFALIAAAAILVVAGGCGSSKSNAPCITGASISCACTSGRTGAQVCQADGTLAACSCTTGAAGGGGTGVGGGGGSGGGSAGTSPAGGSGGGGSAGTAPAGGSGGGGSGGHAGGGGTSGGGGSAGSGGVGGGVGGNIVCFPPATGVPGQPGLPDWWTGTAPFDDPRWVGSYEYSTGTVDFNALESGAGGSGAAQDLILRWHVKSDPGIAGPGDQVWVGFFNTTTSFATVLEFTRDALVNTTAGLVGSGVMSAAAFTKGATNSLWGSVPVPTSIAMDARLDASCNTANDPVVCTEWAIRLRVPMSAASGGIDLGGTFAMWYEVDVKDNDNGTTSQAKWPMGAATVDPTVDPLTFPAPLGSSSPGSSPWFTVSPNGGTCAAGISVGAGDLSVANTLGSGTAIDVSSPNTFHVKPINNTATVYNPTSIQARFRISDWGTAVGNAPQWITIPDASCAAATGSGAGGASGAGGSVVGTGARFDLTCTWTLTAGQRCAYRPDLFPGCAPTPGPRYAQQCILVELSSAFVSIPFSTSSACGNFTFSQSP